MKYTKAQIRGAILRAADVIEHDPAKYSMGSCTTESYQNTGTGCLLMHVGVQLQMQDSYDATQVARDIGMPLSELCNTTLFEFMNSREGKAGTGLVTNSGCSAWVNEAGPAAAGLRAYAEKFYPAEKVAPVAEDRQLVPWSACAWTPDTTIKRAFKAAHRLGLLR